MIATLKDFINVFTVYVFRFKVQLTLFKDDKIQIQIILTIDNGIENLCLFKPITRFTQ